MKDSSSQRRANLEALGRSLSEPGSEWWPFGWLRPEQDERLSTIRCVALATLYGLPAALLALVVGSLLGETMGDLHLVTFPASVCGASFVLFRCVVAPFWNRRALHLRALCDRRQRWQRGAGVAKPD